MNPTTYDSNTQSQRETASAIFVGRQPIYTRDSKTFAYELLFRSDENNQAEFVDGERATAELLLNTFTEIGLERIVGNLPAFINVPEEFILKAHCFALPKRRVVIEVLEDVPPTNEVLAVLSKLKQDGYTIALDDFVYSPELLPLVELANIVKVDLPLIPPDQLANHVQILRRYDLRLLAEKVETVDEYEICKDLGFDYYQGFFFCRPTIVKGKRLPVNRVTMMQLIAKLQNPSVSLNDISNIIQTEPALAYKLLRYVNSAFCGLVHEIESIPHAVTMVGVRQIKTICSLSALAQAADEKPVEFIRTMLIRAKMSELLGSSLQPSNSDSFFLVGLFSGLDGLLNLPMGQALEMVSVSKEVEEAIIHGAGPLGNVLNCVISYEQGNWQQVASFSLENDAIRNAYLQAIEWTNSSIEYCA